VSAFYRIPSKFSVERYFQWMEPFFSKTSFTLVLFTETDLLPVFQKWCEGRGNRLVLVGLPFPQFRAIQKWGGDFWIQQKTKDHEESHTPELYCMWYEKKDFVLRAMDLFKADFYVWCDSGILRFPEWLETIKNFPAAEKLQRGRMTLLQVAEFGANDTSLTNFQHVNRLGGGIQAADEETWRWWSEQYDAMMKNYIASNRFCGKDQSLIASLALSFPGRISLVKPPLEMDGYSKWFWLLLWLS
jgi:hypothetical protein